MSSKNRNLCETSITIDWLRDVLLDSVHLPKDDHQLMEWSAKRIGVGQGFLSAIIQVQLKWESGHKNLPKAVVVKVPTVENMNAHMGDTESRETTDQAMEALFLPIAHKNECTFYEMFKENPPLPVPRSFYTRLLSKEEPGVLVMEDLSAATITVDLSEGLRLEQLFVIADALAPFHVTCFQTKDWEEKFPVQPKDWIEFFSESMSAGCKLLTDLSPELYQGKFEKLAPCLHPDYLYNSMVSNVSLGLPAVLVHGDMWANNLLFKPDPRQANGAGNELAGIIDWQLAHSGNMTEDIARAMVTSCSSALRRQHGAKVLRHYFDRLSQLMEGAVPFTFEDVSKLYDGILPYAMAMFVLDLLAIFGQKEIKEKTKKELLERGAAIMDDIIELHVKLQLLGR